MNLFGLDIDRLDPEEGRAAFSGCPINKLPGVTPFLSKKECAGILGVSMKVINHLVESGQLPLTGIPGDAPASHDLFGGLTPPSRKTYILRASLLDFFEKSLLCHKPILTQEEDR
jgi:hypothetical protein